MSLFKLVNEIKESAIPGNVKLDPVRHSLGIYGSDGLWNAIKWIDNEPYRDTVQCLIIKDKSEVFLSYIDQNNYAIPGGSKEVNVSDDAQVMAECMEEAHIKITNPKFTGIEYHYLNKYKQATDIKNMMKGKHVSLYVADFVNFIDGDFGELENDKIKKGKFYPIVEVFNKLFPTHQRGILLYYRLNNLLAPKELFSPLYKMFDQHSQDLLAVLDKPKSLNEAKGDLDMDDFESPESNEEDIEEDDEEGKTKPKKKRKKVSNTDIDPDDFESPEVDEEPTEEEDTEDDLDADDFEIDTNSEDDQEDGDDLGMDDFETDGDTENQDSTEPAEDEEPADEPNEDGEEPADEPGGDDLGMDDFETDGDTENQDSTEPAEDEEVSAPTDNQEPASNEPTEEVITNVNILKLSNIERAMADKRVFSSFKDLYQKSTILKTSLSNYKNKMDEDILEIVEDRLNDTIELLDEYIKYKFGVNNFEENSKTFVLFTSVINDIVKTISDSLNE